MKKISSKFLTFVILFIFGSMSCSPAGDGISFGESDLENFTGATPEEESESHYSSPSDEGFGIPVGIAKAEIPPPQADHLTVWMSGENLGAEGAPTSFLQKILNRLNLMRAAHATSGSNFCHFKCDKCVIEVPDISLIAVITNTVTGDETVVTPDANRSFFESVSCDRLDPITVHLENADDPSNKSTLLTATPQGDYYVDLAISEGKDHRQLFTAEYLPDIGFTTKQKPGNVLISKIPLSGGLEEGVVISPVDIIHPQWGLSGKKIVLSIPNNAVYIFDTVTQKIANVAKASPYQRWAQVSPDGLLLAISDKIVTPGKGTQTLIRILNLKTGDTLKTVKMDVDFKTHLFKIAPNNADILVVGRKTDPVNPSKLVTVIYRITDIKGSTKYYKVFEGSFMIFDGEITPDSAGFVFVKRVRLSTQIFYQSFALDFSPIQLTFKPGWRNSLAFSGDGTYLVYTRKIKTASKQIYALKYGNSTETQLTNGSDNYRNITFAGLEQVLTYTTTDASGYLQIYVKNLKNLPFLP